MSVKDLVVRLLVDDSDMKKIEKAGDKTSATFSAVGNTLQGAGGTLTKYVTAPALVAGGALAAMTIGPGMDRLTSLDNASAKLSGLGHDAESVQAIMDDALVSVKGTAFGMGDAATLAASVVAAGVQPGEDLQRTLKLVGDAATIAGTDLSSMGSIVNKVATSDMMQMDVANQMMDAGIPILQMVGDVLGVTAEEAREMASAGEISFATFQDALEQGLGGAALKSGETFEGAMGNMEAAMGRTGAAFLEGMFPMMQDAMGRITELFDELAPLATTLGETIGPVLGGIIDMVIGLAEWFADLPEPIQVGIIAFVGMAAAAGPVLIMAGKLASGIGAIIPIAKGMGTAFTVMNAALKANPIIAIVTIVVTLIAALVTWFATTEEGQQAWSEFVGFLGEAWNNIVQFFQDGIAWVTDIFLNWTPLGWIISNWEPIMEFFGNLWTGIMDGASAAVGWVGDRIGDIADFFGSIPERIGDVIGFIGDGLKNSLHGIASGIAWLWNNTLGKIDFTVPDWVPFIGGNRVQFPQIIVPALAQGGVVTRPTLALIGEAGPEAVIPLSGGAQYGVGRTGNVEVEVPVVIDGRELYRIIKRVELREG